MLGIDHQRANIRAVEPGADSGVFGRQWRGRIQGTESRGGLRLGESNAPAATICGAEAQRAGMGAALRGEDDGAEPGADDTADHGVRARRRGEASTLSAAPIPAALYTGRHRPAGSRRRGPPDPEWAGDENLLQRACYTFNETRFQSLARISVAQLYRLRGSRAYRERRIQYQVTRPTPVSIGERRKPDPRGRPGYLRIDTVHQGDQDGVKGVYHINAVDEVTQWEVVGSVGQISEAFLIPVLEAMLAQFPFHIRGFHSDNGSEFINHTVAELLNKLLIEQTKSRPRHSNDNGLAESKNGAVVRKHLGYTHIPAPHAAAIGDFFQEHLNPYLNFHRPCGVPELVVNAKGKEKRVYRWYATPWEILRQLPDVASHLKAEVTIAQLDQQAQAKSDTQAAAEMQEAKRKLFTSFRGKA